MNAKKLTVFTIFSIAIFAMGIPANAMFSGQHRGSDSGGTPSKLITQNSEGGTMPNMSPNEIELELTFLAKERPSELNGVEPEIMVDTYVPKSGFADLRIRKRGGKFEITKKVPLRPGDYSIMKELTIPLNEDEYEELSSVGNRKVLKHRYSVEIEGYPAEVDVFQGDLFGLVLIDFEFKNELEKTKFKVPAVCLADVTQESFIAGGKLAGKKFEDISRELFKFGYRPIY